MAGNNLSLRKESYNMIARNITPVLMKSLPIGVAILVTPSQHILKFCDQTNELQADLLVTFPSHHMLSKAL